MYKDRKKKSGENELKDGKVVLGGKLNFRGETELRVGKHQDSHCMYETLEFMYCEEF